ncbi:MAG: hypothetical protein ACYS47_11780 [Planctomycetota bacterium]|jgi:hypothetical protein
MTCPYEGSSNLRCRIIRKLRILTKHVTPCGKAYESCSLYRQRTQFSFDLSTWPLRFAC